MSNGISKELQEIKANRYGVDIRVPIHDALAKLSNESNVVLAERTGYPSDFADFSYDDIDHELWTIENEPKGSDVKDAIYMALYKLSVKLDEMDPVVVGLKPYPVTVKSITESDDDLLYVNFTNPEENPLVDLRNALISVNAKAQLFVNSNITYEETETTRTLKIKNAFGDDFVTFTGTYRENLDPNPSNFWWYQVKVDAHESSLTYPAQLSYALDYSLMTPWVVYATKGAVLIRCGIGAVLFSTLDDGTLAVSISCGYRTLSTNRTDPFSSIRTFSKDVEVGDYDGASSYFGHGNNIVMTPLIVEGGSGYSTKAYAVLSRVGNGDFNIGSKRFVAFEGFAIEIVKDVTS